MDKKERDQEYKDRVRHGGKRNELLESTHRTCSMCGEKKDSKDICVHHLLDKYDHRFQVPLCRSCHARVHVSDKKPIPEEDLRSIIESAGTLTAASKIIGLTRGSLREKAKKYGMYNRKCKKCGTEFTPNKRLLSFCSIECATEAERDGIKRRNAAQDKSKKKTSDRLYYQKHRDRLIKKQQEYYEQNKEKVLEYHRKLYQLSK